MWLLLCFRDLLHYILSHNFAFKIVGNDPGGAKYLLLLGRSRGFKRVSFE
jgi:hypothetical protein